MPTATDQAKKFIAAHGRGFRTRDALAAGIHPSTLYALRDAGTIEPLTRGLYRLARLAPPADPDLAIVAGRIPQGVICLISALALHDLTTQIPHAVHLAIARTTRYPKLAHPPLEVYRFSKQPFEAGIETRDIGGVSVRLYNAEKTLADCFKYRHKLGLDLVLEALKRYRSKRGANFQRVLEYARVNRVERAMRPYLEALA
ncbi:MAG: type IV toxin-antitoxin system AbiEi family antitoxin domain-containing protein [Planctomycetota bacterium]